MPRSWIAPTLTSHIADYVDGEYRPTDPHLRVVVVGEPEALAGRQVVIIEGARCRFPADVPEHGCGLVMGHRDDHWLCARSLLEQWGPDRAAALVDPTLP